MRWQVLSPAQERFLTHAIVLWGARGKPPSKKEVCAFARHTAAQNGSRSIEDLDLRQWFELYSGRVKRETGLTIVDQPTQQRSKTRGAVLLSGMRAFETGVNVTLSDHPEIAERGLRAQGSWDETKIDLNALLQGAKLLLEGEDAIWEVDSKRCPQITLLIGEVGHEPEHAGVPRRLKDVVELINKVNAAAPDDPLSNPRFAALRDIGFVAGYPKLPASFWDTENYCILPSLLIFEGKTAPDPAWLNYVKDKTKMMLATTESGFIVTGAEYEWYQLCKAYPLCPFGKKPCIPFADSHASNESIEMSLEMEADLALLSAPPCHSTHLTAKLDQRGGANQQLKTIATDLLCHSYRMHGSLSRARIAQVMELAVTLANTPAVSAYTAERVGWQEDERGYLEYRPLSRPHILAALTDDENAQSRATNAIANAHPAGSREARLLAFKQGQTDELQAAQNAFANVFGKGRREQDGWSNGEEDDTLPEAGSRQRRNALPAGRIVAHESFRAAKADQKASKQKALVDATLKQFDERLVSEKVLAFNATAESTLVPVASAPALMVKDAKLNVDELKGFIRARTNKPVPSHLSKKEALQEEAERIRDKPIQVRLGLEPDDYAEWKEEMERAKRERREKGGTSGTQLALTHEPAAEPLTGDDAEGQAALPLPPPPAPLLLPPPPAGTSEPRAHSPRRTRRSAPGPSDVESPPCPPSRGPRTPESSPSSKAAKLLAQLEAKKISPNTSRILTQIQALLQPAP